MGEKYVPRRAQPKRRKWVPIVAGVAAVAVIGGGAGYALLRNNGPDADPPPSTPTPSTANCPTTVSIIVDPDYLAAGQRLAERYGAQFSAGCDPIGVVARPSAEVASSGLGNADGWIPEDPSWVGLATDAGSSLSTAASTPFAHTPLVLAYEPQVRQAMGDERQNGENLVAMLTEAKTYDAYGQPWGVIKLVEPDPATSAAGAIGFATMATMLSHGEPPPTDPTTATENQLRMVAAEHRIVERVASSAEVLTQLAANPADDTVRGPAGPRTGLSTEYAVLNAIADGAELSAEYLGDGAVGVELAVVNPGNHPTIQGFVDWLLDADGRAELGQLGLRTSDTMPTQAALVDAGLDPSPLPALRPFTSLEVQGARQLHAAYAHRASVLTVLDLSGSMAAPFGDSGMRRVDAVTQAALGSWASWPPGYSSGLMTFSTDPSDNPVIQPVFPLQDNRSAEWKAQMPLFQQSLANLQPAGGTPLYLAIWEAYNYNLANYQQGKANKIVVLTDGVDEAHNSPFTWQDLVHGLQTQVDPDKPIEIYYILIGPDSAYPEVSNIASVTGGQALWVRDINELPAVMRSLLVAL